jgi:hypothetical protein
MNDPASRGGLQTSIMIRGVGRNSVAYCAGLAVAGGLRYANPPYELHPAVATGFPVAATVTFALFAQPILVQAGGAQLTTDISPNRPLAGLAIATAISLALLAQPVLVFAGKPQLFTLSATSTAAIINPNPARPDLDGL